MLILIDILKIALQFTLVFIGITIEDTFFPPPEATSTIEESSFITEEFPQEEKELLQGKWHQHYNLIAHALGDIEGRIETNSKEAFLSSYAKGIRVMEADLQLTSDDVLVVRHDFEQISYYNLEQKVYDGDTDMDLARFISEKINYKYTPLTAEDLIALLIEYDDVFWVTDTKDTDPEIIEKQFSQLVELVKETEDETLFDRIIVQIYQEEMLLLINEIYPFSNWIFTLYQIEDPDIEQIATFCQDNAIDVVTMPYNTITLEKSTILQEQGLKVYTHSLNRLWDVMYAQYAGIDGIYSDILTQEDLTLLIVKPFVLEESLLPNLEIN
ncbi:MAG: phosphatidylinositol-specific phospholipase C/glycerophosphodiester phosphodiesterase family protein [Eubacteriales bacterium]